MILLEQYDTDRSAIIEPGMIAPKMDAFPEIAVSCFSKGLLHKYLERLGGEVMSHLETEDGGTPVYLLEYKGIKMAAYMSRVGAPAAAIQMEEMISKGMKKLILLGSCGVLDREIPNGYIILPESAMRDEGLSYHYLPPADEIVMDPEGVAVLKKTFDKLQYPYVIGKVWTTDAIYRETRKKMEERKAQGCIAVDMECSAMHAVAQFRGLKLAQFFYTEDNLDGEEWDPRDLNNTKLKQNELFLTLPFECAVDWKDV